MYKYNISYCSRYIGLPKTVISGAKVSTRTLNDSGIRNAAASQDAPDEDPEDIKVIHFGIV